MEVMMATTVAMRMTPGRENFWIRIVISFILFGFLLLLSCVNCNPVPKRNQDHPREALWNSDLASADSGLQLDLEIALNGVSAKIQPLRLIQPCRR
jgi:hypothetical protein